MGTQPAIFKWRQTEPGLILCAVWWYLRYSLSLPDVEELLEERHAILTQLTLVAQIAQTVQSGRFVHPVG